MIFLLFFTFLFSDNNEKKIEKLDLRDGLIFKSSVDFGQIIDRDRNAGFNKLIKEQIDEIKANVKKFIVDDVQNDEIVILETTLGKVRIKLYPDKAPIHCNNFKKLANFGFYDGTHFHKVIKNFIMQGGDILSRDHNPNNDGEGNPGWTINAEINDLSHTRGTLSMHRTSTDLNSAGSQFFICFKDQLQLDGKYTIFGRVYEEDYGILDIMSNVRSQAEITAGMLLSVKPNLPKDSIGEIMFNDKTYYVNIPEGQDKNIYLDVISDRLKNKNKPARPIIIKKVRVVSENEYTE